MKHWLALAVVVAVAAGGAAAALATRGGDRGTATTTAAGTPGHVVGPTRIAGWGVARDPLLGAAESALGTPAGLRRHDRTCTARWPSLGLTIEFVNLGIANPCGPEQGGLHRATLRGRGWRTVKGLKVGDTLARLRALYPKATAHRTSEWLVVTPDGGVGAYPALAATIAHRRVTAFVVTSYRGGD